MDRCFIPASLDDKEPDDGGPARPAPGVGPIRNRALVSGGVEAAWRFVGPAWRRAWAAMILGGVALGLAMAHSGKAPWIWSLIAGVTILSAAAGLWPLSLGMTPARGGVQARKIELRLLLVAVLSLIFLFVLFMLAFILILCFAYAAASAGHGFDGSQIATWAPAVDDRGRVVVTAVAFAAFAGLAWAAMRISLAAPASVHAGRVQVLASWPLTRRRAWVMVGAHLLNLAGPAIVIALLLAGGARGAGSIGALATVRDLLGGFA